MDDEHQGFPAIELDDLIFSLLLSKEQAERGDVRSVDEILAELRLHAAPEGSQERKIAGAPDPA